MLSHQKEIRILVKHKRSWKLSSVLQVANLKQQKNQLVLTQSTQFHTAIWLLRTQKNLRLNLPLVLFYLQYWHCTLIVCLELMCPICFVDLFAVFSSGMVLGQFNRTSFVSRLLDKKLRIFCLFHLLVTYSFLLIYQHPKPSLSFPLSFDPLLYNLFTDNMLFLGRGQFTWYSLSLWIS